MRRSISISVSVSSITAVEAAVAYAKAVGPPSGPVPVEVTEAGGYKSFHLSSRSATGYVGVSLHGF